MQTKSIITKSIILVGMMGSGKSVIGEKLAQALKLPLKDSDQIIETNTNASIADIFKHRGEAYFRSKEVETIKELLTDKPCVLSCGGGAFSQVKIAKLCEKFGLTIYLKTPIATLWERVDNKSHRPLAQNGFEAFAEILKKRTSDYEKADIIIDCNNKNEHIITSEIIDKISPLL